MMSQHPEYLADDLEHNIEEDHNLDGFEIDDLPAAAVTKTTTSTAIVKKSKKKKLKTAVSKNHRSHEHEQIARQKSLAQNLFVYLEICVNNSMTNRGMATLLRYRYCCKRSETKLNIISLKLYNVLLAGYAEKANLGKVKEILAILKEDQIVCAPQTFAAVFECLGRLPISAEHNKLLREYRLEAELAVSCAAPFVQ